MAKRYITREYSDHIVTANEYRLVNRQMNDKYSAIEDAIGDISPEAGKFLTDCFRRIGVKEPQRNDIREIAAEYNIPLSNYRIDSIRKLIREIREMPTPYFEAKLNRAVPLTEIKYVLYPEYLNRTNGEIMDKVRQALGKCDVPYMELEGLAVDDIKKGIAYMEKSEHKAWEPKKEKMTNQKEVER